MESLVAHEQEEAGDRRAEERCATPERVVWRLEHSTESVRGWISDASPTSVSFVAATWYQPSLGDRVELTTDGGESRRYLVTRIAPYGDHLSLVAGRLLSGTVDPASRNAPKRPLRRGVQAFRC